MSTDYRYNDPHEVERQPAGGRGARERILWAAGELFYRNGIQRHRHGGADQRRACLEAQLLTSTRGQGRADRVLPGPLGGQPAPAPVSVGQCAGPRPGNGCWRCSTSRPGMRRRGACPFHNAAVELAGPDAPSGNGCTGSRATEAGPAGRGGRAGQCPPAGGTRRAALGALEGARALPPSIGDTSPYRDARAAAVALITAQCDAPSRWVWYCGRLELGWPTGPLVGRPEQVFGSRRRPSVAGRSGPPRRATAGGRRSQLWSSRQADQGQFVGGVPRPPCACC